MGARKLYEDQIIKLVQEMPEEKLPAILAQLSAGVLPEKKEKSRAEVLKAIEENHGILKGQLSSVDDFIKWKRQEKALEKW